MSIITEKIRKYYKDQQLLFEEIAGNGDIYNLGYAPPGFRGDFHGAQRELVSLVADKLLLEKGNKVLDIGCGRGGPAWSIAFKYDVHVTGNDLLEEQLRHATASYHMREKADVKFSRSDSQLLPFADESFDRAYSIESAMHYPDKFKFISEAARVIKPEGLLVVADIVMRDGQKDHWTHKGFQKALSSDGLFTPADYLDAAKKVGLKPVGKHDITQGVMSSLYLASKLLYPRIPSLFRKGYRLAFLLAAQAGFLHLRFTHRIIPANYMLFAFRKPLKG